MQNQKQKALVIKEFKKPPVYSQVDIPQPVPGQVQIKIIASTINPSDRILIEGQYWRTQPNFVGGLQGCGQVIKSGCPQGQKLIGKRVSFNTGHGTWAEYTVANIENTWVVDEDVPIESAASGVINPMTVIGFVDTFRKWSNRSSTGKGLINTAAASSLGRMLNRYCQKENIPLLNIVRREQQVRILQKEGVKYIVNTGELNWIDSYKELIKTHGFNVLFDAIGGGQITDKLISNLPASGGVFFYGKFSPEPLVISRPLIFSGGVSVTSFSVFEWLSTLSKQEVLTIRTNLSALLKNELATHSLKHLKLSEVPQELQEAEKRATDGKFTIVI